jgi:uncharacterized protein (TIGR02246 family)
MKENSMGKLPNEIHRRGTLTAAIVALVAAGVLAARPVALVSQEVEQESVRFLPAQVSDAWNKGDGQEVADTFTEHGVLVSSDGTYCDGRAEIDRYLSRLFATHLRGSRFAAKVISVRFLGPDVAFMRLEGDFWMAGAMEPAAERRAVQSLVAVRDAGRWRVALFQATRMRLPRSGG